MLLVVRADTSVKALANEWSNPVGLLQIDSLRNSVHIDLVKRWKIFQFVSDVARSVFGFRLTFNEGSVTGLLMVSTTRVAAPACRPIRKSHGKIMATWKKHWRGEKPSLAVRLVQFAFLRKAIDID